MAIGDKQEHVDNLTFINHAVPHCHSTELYKYVASTMRLSGRFDGKILVRPGAQKTETYQNNKEHCGPHSRPRCMQTTSKFTDDVKCSHARSCGPAG